MHIIIAGCARSGKTTLCKKTRELGFVHYKMDSVKRGVCKHFNIKTTLWTDFSLGVRDIIEQIILDEYEDNILFDTPHLSVEDADYLREKYNVLVVYMGYTSMSYERFKSFISSYEIDTWCSKLDEEELRDLYDGCVKFSIENKTKISNLSNIKYFDISDDPEGVIEQAFNYIRKSVDNGF